MTLKEARKAKGIKATFVAQRLGITVQALYLKEKGLRKFKASEVALLCKEYDVDIKNLVL